jgi:hypothetical protein
MFLLHSTAWIKISSVLNLKIEFGTYNIHTSFQDVHTTSILILEQCGALGTSLKSVGRSREQFLGGRSRKHIFGGTAGHK